MDKMKKPKNRTRMQHEHGYRRHQQTHELKKHKRSERQHIADDIDQEVWLYRESIAPHLDYLNKYNDAVSAKTEADKGTEGAT